MLNCFVNDFTPHHGDVVKDRHLVVDGGGGLNMMALDSRLVTAAIILATASLDRLSAA